MEEEYLDVEIIKNRNEKLKEQYSTFETGIYINGKIKQFEQKEVLDSLFVMIPSEFLLMPDELVSVKYPFVFRPACILTNQDLTINLNFNEFPNHFQDTTMMQVTENVKQALIQESGTFKFSDIKSLNNVEGYYFQFHQNVMDGQLYHMLANIKLNNHIYQLTFNCLCSDYLDWKPAVLQIWESAEYREEARKNESN